MKTKTNNANKSWKLSNIFYMLILILLCSIGVRYLKNNTTIRHYTKFLSNCPVCLNVLNNYKKSIHGSPSFAIYKSNETEGEKNLDNILDVLHAIGWKRLEIEDDWDLLWSHAFPFTDLAARLKNLEDHHRVNHFPGNSHLISKVTLSTSGLPYLPKAFRFPNDQDKFIEFKNDNPKTLFVQKRNSHRHIHIVPADEIKLNETSDNFIQEFLEDPYLVDGYKFDIGVYTVITSVNPLRVYIYTGDNALRFCLEKYYPFNEKNVKQYIVMGEYRPLWKVPSLNEFFEKYKFGPRGSLEAYMKSNNVEPEFIWSQIEHIIRETILANEIYIIVKAEDRGFGKNLFELMRFDLIVDKNFKVTLMEANMSPNLSLRYPQSKITFKQVIYNVYQVIGIAMPLDKYNFKRNDDDTELMISSNKHIAVDSNTCYINKCHEDCTKEPCKWCVNCLSTTELKILHDAYREHTHRGDTKRIFPKPILNLTSYNIEKETEGLNYENQIMTMWFYEKCKMDSTWCT